MREVLDKLTGLLRKRKTFAVKFNHAIGRVLHESLDPERPVSGVIELSDALTSAGVVVDPVFLLDCLTGYRALSGVDPDAILPDEWWDAVNSAQLELKDPGEIEKFIELETEHFERTGVRNESRIERLRRYLSLIRQTAPLVVLHTADLHFDDDGTLPETLRAAEFLLQKAREVEPCLAVIAGDLTHRRLPHDSPGLIEAVRFVTRLSEICPVFVCMGTKGHDGVNLEILRQVKTHHPVFVSMEPQVVFFTGWGFTTIPDGALITIYSLPPVHGGERHSDWIKKFSEIPPSGRAIFVSHGKVAGVTTSSGHVFSEVDYTPEELKTLRVDRFLLGDIHRAQVIDGNIHYSGSLIRRAIDEVEDKGFWLHNLTDGESQFVVVPTRRVHTLRVSSLEDLRDLPVNGVSPGDLVRVIVRVKESDPDVQILERKVQELFSDRGVNLRVERSIIPEHVVRVKGISTLPTVEEKCIRVAELLGIPVTESLRQKIKDAMVDSDD